MPYAPSVAPATFGPESYTAGRSWAGAISNVGDSIAQGMERWQQNDRQDTLTRGQVAALIPQYADKLTNPSDKALIEKFIDHSTDYKKNAYLLGLFTTLKSQDEDRAKQQFVQAQTALLNQQQAAQARAAQQQQEADANLKLGMNAQTNPFIMSNTALARGRAIASDPLYGVASSAHTLGLDPALVERFSTSRYQPNGGPLEPFTMTTTDAKGNPVRTTINKLTGQVIGQGPVIPQGGTPQQQGETALLVEDAKKQVDNAHTFLTDITDNAESARVRASAIKRINALYDSGATSGYGQPLLTQAQALLSRISPMAKARAEKGSLADQQQLDKELNSLRLEMGREYMKGSGAVSNYEQGLVAAATANTSLDPEANRRILNVMGNIADRAVLMDRERQKLDEQGLPSVEIARRIRKMRDSIPVGLEALGGNPADSILDKYGVKPPQ